MLTKEKLDKKISQKLEEARKHLDSCDLTPELGEREKRTRACRESLAWANALEWAREELLKENG